jgi:hypothetical protein
MSAAVQCANGALQCGPVTCFEGSERTGVSLYWLQLAMHRFSVSQAKQCTMKIEVLNTTSSGEHKVHRTVMFSSTTLCVPQLMHPSSRHTSVAVQHLAALGMLSPCPLSFNVVRLCTQLAAATNSMGEICDQDCTVDAGQGPRAGDLR